MPKRNLLLFLTTLGLIITSLLVVSSIKTQRQEIKKKAAEEFKSLYFTYKAPEGEDQSNNYEAILSYKFEYPKFIWRFDKLTCANDKALVQRRFLHIGKTADEVVREGWIDQSFFQWSSGDPLPSGEVNIPSDKGCFFQLDATMTIKPRYGQTKDETNGINKSDKGTISGCREAQPSLTPTSSPSVQPTPTPSRSISLTPTQTPLSTPTPTRGISPTVTLSPVPTATITIRPSVTPTPSAGPSPTASVTPINTPTLTIAPSPLPTVTNQPASPTSTNAPAPTNTITAAQKIVLEPTPTEVQLPSAGIKIPTLGAIIAGFLLISIGLAFVF